MKKLKRLIEVKRQMLLANAKLYKLNKKIKALQDEQTAVHNSFTSDERLLYKERITRAMYIKS